MNDHQENEQKWSARQGCAFLTAMSNQYFAMDRYFRTRFVFALLA